MTRVASAVIQSSSARRTGCKTLKVREYSITSIILPSPHFLPNVSPVIDLPTHKLPNHPVDSFTRIILPKIHPQKDRETSDPSRVGKRRQVICQLVSSFGQPRRPWTTSGATWRSLFVNVVTYLLNRSRAFLSSQMLYNVPSAFSESRVGPPDTMVSMPWIPFSSIYSDRIETLET